MPLETVAVPRVVLPTLNVTVPVPPSGVTVAPSVVVPLRTTEFGVAVTTVAVAAGVTEKEVLPLEPAKLASPL
jgi:hypothetical protein